MWIPEIWEASKGKSTNKYTFPPFPPLSPLQSDTNRHVQVHMRAHTHRNPSQDHLAKRATYKQAVSCMNISCWGWTAWLKNWCYQTISLALWCLIMFANIIQVLLSSSCRFYHNVSWIACQHPLSPLLHPWSNQILGTIKVFCSLVMNCIYRAGWECIFRGPLCWNYVQPESRSEGSTGMMCEESSCVSSWTNKRAFKKKRPVS